MRYMLAPAGARAVSERVGKQLAWETSQDSTGLDL